MDVNNLNTKTQLRDDINHIVKLAAHKEYLLQPLDVFALGYLAGKYDLQKLFNNNEELNRAVESYDAADDLGLFDTIAETLIDLGVMQWEEKQDGK